MFVYELSGCGFEPRCCHPLYSTWHIVEGIKRLANDSAILSKSLSKSQANKNKNDCYIIVTSEKLKTLNGDNIETKKTLWFGISLYILYNHCHFEE